MAQDEQESDWQATTARSLAFIALHASGLREKDLATQGQFLEGLGMSRADAASLLGTSRASLTELYRQARNKKGRGRGNSKKKK